MTTPRQQDMEAAINAFAAKHPEFQATTVKAEIPAPLKWAAGILSAVAAAGMTAGAISLISTVDDMKITLSRLDERLASWNAQQEMRYVEFERRIAKLEKAQER